MPSSLQPPASSLFRTNVADRLAQIAAQMPDAVAVACPGRGDVAGQNSYSTCTFRELDDDATALARGMVDKGVSPGTRLALLVPPSIEFVKLVFALLRSGATTILVDPGMGREHLVNCLATAEPEGFIGVGKAQAARVLYRQRFPRATFNVTVGRRWFWRGTTYRRLLERGRTTDERLPATHADDPAAIIFTSGSTGPPKGVLYTHRMFETQTAEIQRQYDLQPGGADLACFALFGLFNSAMGVTTVFPDMNFSRPASADPRKLLAAANDWRVTQAFASPAVWDTLSRHCEATSERILTLRKVFSCGAPVRPDVIRRTLACVAAGAEMHTPYGATEALPVATIEAREILGETAAASAAGAGVCVGRKFDSIEWRVIRMTDEPISSLDDVEELPQGEIGELIVRGPQVSSTYLPAPSPRRGGSTEHGRSEIARAQVVPGAKRSGRGEERGYQLRPLSPALPARGREPEDALNANTHAKVADANVTWHRLGDVGYFDPQGRFWYCGRKAHRVETPAGTLFTECVEAVFNEHAAVRRCALVGLGSQGKQIPLVVIEGESSPLKDARQGMLKGDGAQCWRQLQNDLRSLAAACGLTEKVDKFLLIPEIAVDTRHNAKIDRESATAWAMDVIQDFNLQSEYGLEVKEPV